MLTMKVNTSVFESAPVHTHTQSEREKREERMERLERVIEKGKMRKTLYGKGPTSPRETSVRNRCWSPPQGKAQGHGQ